MEKVVLDTDVLIDFLRGAKGAVETVSRLKAEGTHLCTTVINAFELYWGAYKLGDRGKVEKVDKLLDHVETLKLTSDEAKVAGEEMAYLESLGLRVDVRDLLVGVLARESGCAVLTGNTEHFSRLRGLKVKQYKR